MSVQDVPSVPRVPAAPPGGDLALLHDLKGSRQWGLVGRASSELPLVMRAQEEERERLAYDVHDRIAQPLASAFQQLQRVETLAASLTEVRQAAVRASALVRQAIRESRSIMNDLRPPLLEDLGLVPLVKEELRRLAEESGCRTDLRLCWQVRPPRDVEIVIYRILHEALINIRRHANAEEVRVTLESDDGNIHLQVEDNGAGFDVAAALAQKHVGGLVSMRRRTELTGGVCHLHSTPGQGTRVSVCIPTRVAAQR